jgi:hypothetical protein
MVEVFKTNVREPDQSKKLVQKLLEHLPQSRINFDLEDCDKILRVEGENIMPQKIIEVVHLNGYQCQVLE